MPRFNFDKAQTLASMDAVEKPAADTHARVVREHVMEDFTSLPKFPAALNWRSDPARPKWRATEGSAAP